MGETKLFRLLGSGQYHTESGPGVIIFFRRHYYCSRAIAIIIRSQLPIMAFPGFAGLFRCQLTGGIITSTRKMAEVPLFVSGGFQPSTKLSTNISYKVVQYCLYMISFQKHPAARVVRSLLRSTTLDHSFSIDQIELWKCPFSRNPQRPF
jgi:hypothetical protein